VSVSGLSIRFEFRLPVQVHHMFSLIGSGLAAANNIWKIPGGMVDPGEDIMTAAAREVFEETGIKTRFENLLCFRHHHKAAFGKSDLYFICKLRPLNLDLSPCPKEIADCKWMPLDDFLSLPYYRGVYKKMMEIASSSVKADYKGLTAEKLPIVFRKGENFLYHARL